jgi:release factor glutamine methyltransferase
VGVLTKIEIEDCIKETVALLTGKTEFPVLETQVLLASVLQTTREWVITHSRTELTENQHLQFLGLRERLLSGEPLPYLTGIQAFFGLDFEVNNHVLIPRPETELLVEESIAWLELYPSRRSAADIGTGSGIIAICLADHFPDLQLLAVDSSTEALAVAKRNALKFKVNGQIQFLNRDLLTDINTEFDLIAANLPYIPSTELSKLTVSKFEPNIALNGGEDGLLMIRKLIGQARNNLNPGGVIILEIESNQSSSCTEIAKQAFPSARITTQNDLVNYPRIVKIQSL